jgi:hypothetical protein
VAALANVLTRDVERVVPDGRRRGRGAVVAEYRRQFAANDTDAYRLDDLQVSGGTAGRAAGRYRVTVGGQPRISGRIVFGVVRDHGRPRIALIAATPDD